MAVPAAPAETTNTRPRGTIIPARGLSCNSAIVMKATTEQAGIAEEHAWVQENYPGALKVPVQQSLTKMRRQAGRSRSRSILRTAGKKRRFYFDISNLREAL